MVLMVFFFRDLLGNRHFSKVLASAVSASTQYDRAISVMYDLSGMQPAGVTTLLNDAQWILDTYKLFDRQLAPGYLFHFDCCVGCWI